MAAFFNCFTVRNRMWYTVNTFSLKGIWWSVWIQMPKEAIKDGE